MQFFRSRTAEELIIMGVAIVSLCGLIPYGIYRLNVGQYFIAGIEFAGAILCLFAIYQVSRHQNVDLYGALMSVSAVFGVLIIVHAEGIGVVQFIFPVVVLSYFLIKPLYALLLTGVAGIGLFMILHSEMNLLALSKIVLPLVGCSLFAFLFATIRNQQNEQLQLLSTKDPLTGILNRRSLDEKLSRIVLQAKRQPVEAVLIILDLDNFKQINDREGHVVGDEVLKRVATTIAGRIRATDEIYRFGGDEFVIIANDATLEQSLGLAEDLRTRVEATEAMQGTDLSISLGVSAYEPGQTAQQWLARADSGLLEAKSNGRNTIVSLLGQTTMGQTAARSE